MSDTTPQQVTDASFNLDALLTPADAAHWLKMAERTLLDNVRRKKIPCVRINNRVLRFHPRSILAAKGAK
ncbi:MAG: helix-turn-helix domain-containing protein [Verrucomicrobiales bacterium]|nr:helix-turn-helix domain-containing protein [Verrucomicrobiales bacterium]